MVLQTGEVRMFAIATFVPERCFNTHTHAHTHFNHNQNKTNNFYCALVGSIFVVLIISAAFGYRCQATSYLCASSYLFATVGPVHMLRMCEFIDTKVKLKRNRLINGR